MRRYKKAFKPTKTLFRDVCEIDLSLTYKEKVFMSIEDGREPVDSSDILYREVLYIDDKPAAYCELYDETFNRVYVAICVDKNFRGMNLSEKMIDRMFKTVTETEDLKDKKFIWLVNRDNNKSIYLAKKYGFKTTSSYKRLKYRG